MDGFLVPIEGPSGWKLNAYVPASEESSPTGAQSHVDNLLSQLSDGGNLSTSRATPIGETATSGREATHR